MCSSGFCLSFFSVSRLDVLSPAACARDLQFILKYTHSYTHIYDISYIRYAHRWLILKEQYDNKKEKKSSALLSTNSDIAVISIHNYGNQEHVFLAAYSMKGDIIII